MAAITATVIAAAAVAGVGLSAYGAIAGSQAASKAASAQSAAYAQQSAAQQEITKKELEAEAVRKKAAELDARRRQLEIIRQGQRARAMSLTSATNQNAGLGSGLQGGYGQIAGQSGTQLLGVSQGLDLGNQLFGINADISQQKIALAQAGGAANQASARYGAESAFASGLSSLGGALISNLGTIKSLSGGFGNTSNYTFGPNSPSSYGYLGKMY